MPKKGYKATNEHRRKISDALKGKTPKNFAEMQKKGWAIPRPTGENNPCWKGDDVGYHALHAWVQRELGTPKKCVRCGTTKAKRYEWANISREYKRNLSDWERLCVSCHRKEGYERGEYETWNKGKSIQTNTGRTHIKPGQRLSIATEFKKGLVPWNRYLDPKHCKRCGELFQPREATRKFCSKRCYWDSLKK